VGKVTASKEQPARKHAVRWGYWGLLVAILAGGVAAYFGWWSNFRACRPEFSTAEPLTIREKAPSRSVLLWSESILTSPLDGAVHYPLGVEPVRVGKGDVVAEVLTGSQRAIVRAPFSGYFIPGLDGLEGKWNFSDVWPGDGELPAGFLLRPKAEGERVGRGGSLGKLIPQPQELRAIAYVEMDESVRGQIGKGVIMFAFDGERPQRALVRAVHDFGPKAKVYMTLPIFPMSITLCRSKEIEFFHGEMNGVVLPESAVIQKAGAMGVYAFASGKLEYRSVSGQPLPGARFLVVNGLKAGDLVLSRASAGGERKVLLW
jgi:hypothetical protein